MPEPVPSGEPKDEFKPAVDPSELKGDDSEAAKTVLDFLETDEEYAKKENAFVENPVAKYLADIADPNDRIVACGKMVRAMDQYNSAVGSRDNDHLLKNNRAEFHRSTNAFIADRVLKQTLFETAMQLAE